MMSRELEKPYIIWFRAWRRQITCAKAYPEEAEDYCRGAVISHAMYEISLAQHVVDNSYESRSHI